MAKAAAIYLTELDLIRLENAANHAGGNSPLAGLVDDPIARANVVSGNRIPADVVTMSPVVYVMNDTGAEQEWTLVYPGEASVASAKLSVFSLMGAALLGIRAGKSIKYSTPNGAQCSLRIDRVVFQPEAAGQHTL